MVVFSTTRKMLPICHISSVLCSTAKRELHFSELRTGDNWTVQANLELAQAFSKLPKQARRKKMVAALE